MAFNGDFGGFVSAATGGSSSFSLTPATYPTFASFKAATLTATTSILALVQADETNSGNPTQYTFNIGNGKIYYTSLILTNQ